MDVASVDSGEVSGSSLDVVVLISVDNERSLSENVSGVSHFTLSSSDLSGVSGSSEFLSSSELSEGSDEGLGGFDVQGVNDQGEFWDFRDSVSSGEHQGSDS